MHNQFTNRVRLSAVLSAVTMAAILSTHSALADTSISYTGGTYTQNFNTLWTNGTGTNNGIVAPTNFVNPDLSGPFPTGISLATVRSVPIDLTGPSVDIDNTIINLSLPAPSTLGLNGWYAYNAGGNPGTGQEGLRYNVSDGTSNMAALTGFYDPTKQGSGNNMAMGLLTASESGNVIMGMKLINNTGATLNAATISYTGQLFHQDASTKSLQFGFTIAAANSTIPAPSTADTFGALNVGNFATGVDAAVGTDTPGATQAKSVTNMSLVSSTGAVWAPGTALWITWEMSSGGGGQGISIDDLSFSASTVAAQPTVTWTHAGSENWDNASQNWDGATHLFANGNNVAFTAAAADTVVTIQAGGVAIAASVTISNNNATKYTFTGGSINGASASLNITGTGTVELQSVNGYGNGTNISAGKLMVSNNNQLGAVGGALTLSGGTIQLTGAGLFDAGTRVLKVTTGTTGTFDTGGRNAKFGPDTNSLPDIKGRLNVTGGGSLNLGIFPGFGTTGSLNIASGTNVIIDGGTGKGNAISFYASTHIDGNLIIRSAPNAAGPGTRVNFSSPGVFNTTTGISTGTNGATVIDGSGEIQIESGSHWVVHNILDTVAGVPGLDGQGVIFSNVSGNLGATIAVKLHLNSLNLPQARMDVTDPNAFSAINNPNTFIISMGGTKNNGSGSGGIGINFANAIYTGVISGNADVNIGNDWKSGGSGNTTFAAHNTYHGTTMLNGGGAGFPVLIMGIENALPSDTDVIFGTISGAGTPSLDLAGFDQTIRSLSVGVAGNSPNLNKINNTGGHFATLTINGDITPANPYNGQINDGGPILTNPLGTAITGTANGQTALVKDGAGTLVLGMYLDNLPSNHFTLSTYSGGTTVKRGGGVNPGILQISFDGALGASTGPLTVDGGQVSIQNPSLNYVAQASMIFISDRLLTVTSNGGIFDTPAFTPIGAPGSQVEPVTFTGLGGYAWNSTAAKPLILSGAAGSSYTLNGGAGSVAVSAGASIQINSGVTLNVNGSVKDPFTQGANHVDIVNNSTTTFNVTAGSVQVGALSGAGNTNVSIGATLTANSIKQNAITVNGTVHVAANGGPTGLSIVKTLNIPTDGLGHPTGNLDLNDNDLIVNYAGGPSPFTSVRSMVSYGLNHTVGITSTTGLIAPQDKVLAVVDNANHNLTSLSGVTLASVGLAGNQQILGKYTYFGDANLDGKVTGSDYTFVDSNLNRTDSGVDWLSGDFNLDGKVTGADYTFIDSNLGKGTATPLAYDELQSEMIALHTAEFGAEYTSALEALNVAVPEPTSLGLLSLGAVALLSRRRRSK